MGTALLSVACVCVVVGIYFFFVRARPDEGTQQQP